MIGLELSADELRRLTRQILIGGGLQTGLTTALGAGAAYLLTGSWRQSLLLGAALALSSTAIVLRLYSERRELDTPAGRVNLGILLFQDFLIVPLLLLVPVLAGQAASAGDIVLRFGGGLLAVAAVFAAGRFLLPHVLEALARTRLREMLVLGALFLCLGGALATHAVGFSMALGSFLAGLLIGGSDYRHQVMAEMSPFRDAFNSLFFISVGMLLQLDFAVAKAPLILALGAGILVLKAAVVFLAVALLGLPWRIRILSGLALAQIGEFSFLLVSSAYGLDLIDTAIYQTAIATAILTMLITPLLIALAPRVAEKLSGNTRRETPGDEASAGHADLHHHVLIVGYGLTGQHLARVLRPSRRPYLILELDDHEARRAREAGEPVFFGDAARRSILEECGIESAQMLVLAISDPLATRQTVQLARQLNPKLHILARTRDLDEIEELQRHGADEVIAYQFETSIEITTRVLRRLHVPTNVIRAQARLLRQDGYQILRTPSPTGGLSESAIQALAAGTTETFLLLPEHTATGQTIAQLNLRHRTGATIIALVRGETPYPNPAIDQPLETGDVLVLVGSHAEIEQAFSYLAEGGE